MASAYSLRPAKRIHRSAVRPSTLKPKPSKTETSSSEEDTQEEQIDLDKIRLSRASYYSMVLEEREERSATPAESSKTRRTKSGHKKASERRTSSSIKESKSKPRSSHHRRRRRKSKEEDSSDDHVYKQAGSRVSENAAGLRPRARSVALPERRANHVPDRVRILRTLGLEPPQRTRSRRSATTVESGKRHTHHGRTDTSETRDAQAAEGIAVTGTNRSQVKR